MAEGKQKSKMFITRARSQCARKDYVAAYESYRTAMSVLFGVLDTLPQSEHGPVNREIQLLLAEAAVAKNLRDGGKAESPVGNSATLPPPPGYDAAPPPGYNPILPPTSNSAPPPGYNMAEPPGYNANPPPLGDAAPPPGYDELPPPAFPPPSAGSGEPAPALPPPSYQEVKKNDSSSTPPPPPSFSSNGWSLPFEAPSMPLDPPPYSPQPAAPSAAEPKNDNNSFLPKANKNPEGEKSSNPLGSSSNPPANPSANLPANTQPGGGHQRKISSASDQSTVSETTAALMDLELEDLLDDDNTVGQTTINGHPGGESGHTGGASGQPKEGSHPGGETAAPRVPGWSLPFYAPGNNDKATPPPSHPPSHPPGISKQLSDAAAKMEQQLLARLKKLQGPSSEPTTANPGGGQHTNHPGGNNRAIHPGGGQNTTQPGVNKKSLHPGGTNSSNMHLGGHPNPVHPGVSGQLGPYQTPVNQSVTDIPDAPSGRPPPPKPPGGALYHDEKKYRRQEQQRIEQVMAQRQFEKFQLDQLRKGRNADSEKRDQFLVGDVTVLGVAATQPGQADEDALFVIEVTLVLTGPLPPEIYRVGRPFSRFKTLLKSLNRDHPGLPMHPFPSNPFGSMIGRLFGRIKNKRNVPRIPSPGYGGPAAQPPPQNISRQSSAKQKSKIDDCCLKLETWLRGVVRHPGLMFNCSPLLGFLDFGNRGAGAGSRGAGLRLEHEMPGASMYKPFRVCRVVCHGGAEIRTQPSRHLGLRSSVVPHGKLVTVMVHPKLSMLDRLAGHQCESGYLWLRVWRGKEPSDNLTHWIPVRQGLQVYLEEDRRLTRYTRMEGYDDKNEDTYDVVTTINKPGHSRIYLKYNYEDDPTTVAQACVSSNNLPRKDYDFILEYLKERSLSRPKSDLTTQNLGGNIDGELSLDANTASGLSSNPKPSDPASQSDSGNALSQLSSANESSDLSNSNTTTSSSITPDQPPQLLPSESTKSVLTVNTSTSTEDLNRMMRKNGEGDGGDGDGDGDGDISFAVDADDILGLGGGGSGDGNGGGDGDGDGGGDGNGDRGGDCRDGDGDGDGDGGMHKMASREGVLDFEIGLGSPTTTATTASESVIDLDRFYEIEDAPLDDIEDAPFVPRVHRKSSHSGSNSILSDLSDFVSADDEDDLAITGKALTLLNAEDPRGKAAEAKALSILKGSENAIGELETMSDSLPTMSAKSQPSPDTILELTNTKESKSTLKKILKANQTHFWIQLTDSSGANMFKCRDGRGVGYASSITLESDDIRALLRKCTIAGGCLCNNDIFTFTRWLQQVESGQIRTPHHELFGLDVNTAEDVVVKLRLWLQERGSCAIEALAHRVTPQERATLTKGLHKSSKKRPLLSVLNSIYVNVKLQMTTMIF